MNKQSKIIALILVLMLGVISVYFFVSQKTPTEPQGVLVSDDVLERIKSAHPDLTSFVDDIAASQNAFFTSTDVSPKPYLELGFAWKSLADRTRDKEHYAQALLIYEEGAQQTGRNNTVLLENAGNMSVYIEEYTRAEAYFKEALKLAPGDTTAYIELAELYEYRMGRPVDEIVALLDQGIQVAVPPTDLINYRRALLERHMN